MFRCSKTHKWYIYIYIQLYTYICIYIYAPQLSSNHIITVKKQNRSGLFIDIIMASLGRHLMFRLFLGLAHGLVGPLPRSQLGCRSVPRGELGRENLGAQPCSVETRFWKPTAVRPCCSFIFNHFWLVVWNIFYFPYILGIIVPTDSYFSEGLKPPARFLL